MSKKSKRTMSRTVRVAMGIFIAFIVSVATAACLVSFSIKTGICSDNNLKKSINESDYYEQKLSDINEALIARIEATGLPAAVAEDVVTDRMVAVDSDIVIRAMLAGEEYSVNTESMKERLTDNINKYYEELGIEPDDTLAEATGILVRKAAKDYESRLEFDYADYYVDYSNRYRSVCNTVIGVSLIIILVCIVLSLLLHSKKYRGLRYINYGLISGSIIAIIVNRLVNDRILDILSDSEYTYIGIVRQYVSAAFSQGLYICCAGVLAFLVMCIMTLYMRRYSI